MEIKMNVIAAAFAFEEDYGNSPQLTGRSDEQKIRVYMRNIVVSLISAHRMNPDDRTVLVTNADIPGEYRKELEDGGVEIERIEFDSFRMPKKFIWSLAFFKLCALEYLLNNDEYEKILLVDSDTYTVKDFKELWKEADKGILLYNVCHSIEHPERVKIIEDYRKLYPEEDENIVHYGGEFICGRKENISRYIEECREVYKRICASDYDVQDNIGDETLTAIAAAHLKRQALIIEAGAYVTRYWTEERFYLVSTNTVYNPVCVWHLPGEKDKGMLIMYDYYIKHKVFPELKKSLKIYGLADGKRPYFFDSMYAKWVRRNAKK